MNDKYVTIIGGYNQIGLVPRNDVEIYSFETKKWNFGPPLSQPRFCSSICLHQFTNHITVAGGHFRFLTTKMV